MKRISLLIGVLISGALQAGPALAADAATAQDDIARGRYLVTISGCNDCHTPGYMQTEGKVAEGNWLVGGTTGFQGGWGTTYPTNLRLLAQALSEDEWLRRTSGPLRPPMPWFALRSMTSSDRRAIFRYIRHLGPAGAPAPAYVLPGRIPITPVIVFEPVAPSTAGQPLASAPDNQLPTHR